MARRLIASEGYVSTESFYVNELESDCLADDLIERAGRRIARENGKKLWSVAIDFRSDNFTAYQATYVNRIDKNGEGVGVYSRNYIYLYDHGY